MSGHPCLSASMATQESYGLLGQECASRTSSGCSRQRSLRSFSVVIADSLYADHVDAHRLGIMSYYKEKAETWRTFSHTKNDWTY